MSKKEEKLLLFDVDGVIVDSLNYIYEGALAFIKKHGGKKITLQQYQEAFKGNVIEEVFELAGLSSNQIKVTKEDMELFFKFYDKTVIYTGMKDLLENLARDNTLVVITSTVIDYVTKKFDKEGITDLFAGFLGPTVSAYKDKKTLMALEEFSFAPQDALFISDTSGDIKEVNQTGVKTIGVTWGVHNKKTLEEANPTAIVQTVKELEKLLTNL